MTNRKLHRWLSWTVAVPFSIVMATGCLLQIKRWMPAIQPASAKSEHGSLSKAIPIEKILESLRSVPEAKVESWKDVKVVDIRPALGVARARTGEGYEVQVDLATGEVLSSAQRYTGVLIELHEGTFFGPAVRDFIFTPSAFLAFLLLVSGLLLMFRTYSKRYKKNGLFSFIGWFPIRSRDRVHRL